MTWQITKARDGETEKLLQEGWEPFAVVAEDASYTSQNSYNNKPATTYRSMLWIYFRREEKVK